MLKIEFIFEFTRLTKALKPVLGTSDTPLFHEKFRKYKENLRFNFWKI